MAQDRPTAEAEEPLFLTPLINGGKISEARDRWEVSLVPRGNTGLTVSDTFNSVSMLGSARRLAQAVRKYCYLCDCKVSCRQFQVWLVHQEQLIFGEKLRFEMTTIYVNQPLQHCIR